MTESMPNPPVELSDELCAMLRRNLWAHELRTSEAAGLKRASVAVVIVDSEVGSDATDPHLVTEGELDVIPGGPGDLDGEMRGVAGGAAFLLCRRAARMNSHSAQWALPGGRIDSDETPEETALRELDEELGVRLPPSSILGRLDDYPTRSGYIITPVVVWGGAGLTLVPSPDEVAHVYRIGLHELRRPDSPRFVTIPESPRPVVQVPLGGDLVHAPTGAVLLQFRWVAMDGRINERVDDFEQPVFAWR
jgi:8-oxo-dGTP pyrophosphatase MutT (NUDIX family)